MAAAVHPQASLIPEGVGLAWAPQPGPQTALVTCPVYDALYGGARGGGKTDGLLGDFLGHSAAHPKHSRGLFLRRTYDELDEAVARSMEIYGLLDATWKAGKHTWHFPWGSRLRMRYLKRDEDASHYQGHSYTWLGVDEMGNFPKPDPLDRVRATLRSKHGVPTRFRASANPGGPGHAWIHDRYIKPAPPFVPFLDQVTGAQRVYIPSRLEDNALLMLNDPGYRERLRQSGPGWLVRAWLLGDWNATPEGGIFRGAWLRQYWDNLPSSIYAYVISLDTGYKENETNDPSVATVWGISPSGYYLVDVWRERCDYPRLKQAVKSLAEKWTPTAILIEDKASGISLIQELRSSTTLPVIAIEPKGDKYARAVAATPTFEAGKVYLPRVAPWLLDYEIELTCFPTKGMHDDQVDSTSQFIIWATQTAAARFEVASSGQKRVGHDTEGF